MNPDDPLGLMTPPQKGNPNDPLGLMAPAHKPKIGQMGHAITEDASPDQGNDDKQVLGGIASLAHDIPGAEALQAGARSLFRGQSYSDALSDIKGAEESAPKGVRMFNNAAGGTIAALAGPKGGFMNPLGKGGSAAIQGARLGAAQGLLSADPASGEERLLKAGKGGLIGGAVAGLVGDVAPNVARVIKAKSLGANAMQRGAQMAETDAKNYGKALSQGRSNIAAATPEDGPAIRTMDGRIISDPKMALHVQIAQNNNIPFESVRDGGWVKNGEYRTGSAAFQSEDIGQGARARAQASLDGKAPEAITPPPLQVVKDVLDSPGIRGYAKAARNSPSLAGADDATVLHETYKRLGERQRGLEAQIERAANYKAGPAREVQDIELMKRNLLDAADKIMPGYRDAVQGHAELAGQTEAFQNAADQTKRVVNKTSVAGRNLGKNTADAFKAQIVKLDKAKAEAAREAVLGRVQEQAGDALNKNPLKGFGLPSALGKIGRASPYLRQLDNQIDPDAMGPALRSALAVALGSHAGN